MRSSSCPADKEIDKAFGRSSRILIGCHLHFPHELTSIANSAWYCTIEDSERKARFPPVQRGPFASGSCCSVVVLASVPKSSLASTTWLTLWKSCETRITFWHCFGKKAFQHRTRIGPTTAFLHTSINQYVGRGVGVWQTVCLHRTGAFEIFVCKTRIMFADSLVKFYHNSPVPCASCACLSRSIWFCVLF